MAQLTFLGVSNRNILGYVLFSQSVIYNVVYELSGLKLIN